MLSVFYFDGRNGIMPACRQTGKKKVRRNPIIPLFPAYRQAGIIPIPYDKLVTNYNLEY